MIGRIIALVLALSAALPASASAKPVRTERLEVELAPLGATATPGAVYWVALRHEIAPGWHTYWRNPGDSGGATEIRWTLPAGWSAGDILWPKPERQRFAPATANLVNYAYSGEVFLPVPIQIPADARIGETRSITAVADFKVCSDTLCVPETAEVSLTVRVADGPAPPHPGFGEAVAAAMAAAPKPAGIRAVASMEGGRLRVAALGGPLAGVDPAGAYFFADQPRVVVHSAEQTIERGAAGFTLTIEPSATLVRDGLTGPVTGVLATPSGAWEITAAPGPIPERARGGGPAPSADAVERGGDGGLASLFAAIAFAVAGGLLLNLMPCVFPVLSMKAASLARAAHAPADARADGLAFGAGVMASFLGLAAVLLLVRTGGEAAGWGFQLQNPWVTAFLSLVMLGVALNLSGVFSAGGGLQAAAGGRTMGAFGTGVLAVVVAAPCTAPFMAAALGYALTAPAPQTMAVFGGLGLGFAAPYVALSLSPRLLARAPKPGPWMEGLRRLLAFPMYAAAAWMAWVFSRQTGDLGLAWLFAAAVSFALAAHLFGRSQTGAAGGATLRIWACAALLGAAGFAALAALQPAPAARSADRSSVSLASEPWSDERVQAALAQGRPVLVNFTADWCVTCKVNEQVALSGARVREAVERSRTTYLVADWTLRDEAIARELAAHGRAGVPLYLVYAPGDSEPVILAQLLTEGAVIAALETASERASR